MAFIGKSSRGLLRFALGLVAIAVAATSHAATPIGSDVSNTAQFAYDHDGRKITFPTNEATFSVVARPTPSSIDFFRYAPTAPDGISVALNGSDYLSADGFDGVPSPIQSGGPGSGGNPGTGTGFIAMDAPRTLGGIPIDVSGPVTLIPSETYLPGELLIVRITDLGQNGQPDVVETVVGTLSSDNGDTITLRFYESGPNTGQFFAYVPTDAVNTDTADAILGAPRHAQLTARYVDAFDATEVSVDTALVDPFGRVFDSLTGELVDGARVTLINDATGQPAEVFGIDGVSPYPSSVITGSTVTDESGLVYPLEPGEYLFPLIAPGDYSLQVEPPAQYRFPSVFDAADFTDLPTAPFDIGDGSYGLRFNVDGSGVVILDIPVDGSQNLTVRKQAGVTEAAVGDFIAYTLMVDNTNDGSLPVILEDTLPPAVRYMEGSATLNGQAMDDPEISANGGVLTFRGPRIAPGETQTFAYVVSVGAGIPDEGDLVNLAQAVSPRGAPLSNTSEAVVAIREDLFRSRLTLLGRVAENACDVDDPWARPLEDGIGVPGVRLYLETGEFVVTDEDGLYHFQGVEEGTHVVRIDPATLPDGYTPVVCEENTRFAGDPTSQFVDVRGGTIWRANFYLMRTGDTEADARAEDAAADTEFNDRTEYRDYDQAWLNTQTGQPADTVEWIYPNVERTPSVPSVNVGIKAAFGTQIQLTVNGRPVSSGNSQQTVVSTDRSLALLRWRSLDIIHGENTIEAAITHTDGRTETMVKSVWYVTEADRAVLVDDQSVMVADGRTQPVIAVRMEDANGRPVRKGARVRIDLPVPYRLASEDALDALRPAGRPGATFNEVTVGNDGIAHIELAPTLETGRLRFAVPLNNNRFEEIEAYLVPERRDWIVVGLADTTLEMVDGELETPGRAALFAKGMIKGDWLLTVAIDTATRRGQEDREIFNRINPNAYYTLYGDRTFQGDDAESRYPVFVRMERETAMLMFGDFNTALNESELMRYNRRLSGFKADYVTDRFEATAFASETNQRFQREEIGADGTSGPFDLAGAPYVRTSETVIIETRDRFRPDTVLSTTNLERDRDYEIDYTNGTLRLRSPIPPTDVDFNPNVIVVELESRTSGERVVTAGGRAAVRGLRGRLEAGASIIRDEAGRQASDVPVTLAGVDVKAAVTDTFEVRAEIATSVTDDGPRGQDSVTGNAFLIEGVEVRERVGGRAFLRQEDQSFGIGQSASSTATIRRMGMEGDVIISETVDPNTNDAKVRSVVAQALREEALDTGESRDLGEIAVRQTSQNLTAGLGLRAVTEDLNTGSRESLLVTSEARKTLPTIGLTLGVAHESPIGSGNEAGDETALFPERTILTADQALFAGIDLNVRHEILDGANTSGTNTLAGITAKPWRGARLNAGLDELTQESGRRLASNIGLDQTVQITSAWSAGFGVANRARINGDDDGFDPLADDAVSPFEGAALNPLSRDEGFSSAYVGVGYLGPVTAGSVRVEIRDSADETRHAVGLGAARELSEIFSFAGAMRLENSDQGPGLESTDAEIRLGTSYRPRGEGVIVLDRFDVRVTERPANGQTTKLINNLAINQRLSDATQASTFWGVKYTTTELNDQTFDG
ncbi:MAG: hypothetical protein AAF253_08545, partial [Pseudomonadota bacterium]